MILTNVTLLLHKSTRVEYQVPFCKKLPVKKFVRSCLDSKQLGKQDTTTW